MSTFRSTFIPIRPAARRWLTVALLCTAGWWIAPTAIPAQIVQPGEDLPLDQNPNDPFISTEERLERQRMLIQRQIADRQQRIEAERKAKLEEDKQAILDQARQQQGARQGAPATAAGSTTGTTASKSDMLATGHRQPYVTFYLTPPSQNVTAGDVFSTECRLLNPQALAIDTVQIALHYPAGVLEPVRIHQGELQPFLKAPPQTRLDAEQGILYYRGELARPNDGAMLSLVTIVWKALAPTTGVKIETVVTLDGQTVESGAFRGEKPLSHSSLGDETARLGATVVVARRPGTMPAGLKMLNEQAGRVQETLAGAPDQAQLPPPGLWIEQPQSGMLEPGEWVVIDIGMDNPAGALFDEIRLAGRFDPAAVELVDADQGNWIVRGRNVLDGPFQQQWPWEMHFENRIDQDRGVFYYRMAGRQPVSGGPGPIVRLFARIKEPTAAPLIQWVWNAGKPAEQPQTAVLLVNRDLFLRAGIEAPASPAPFDINEPWEKADPATYRF